MKILKYIKEAFYPNTCMGCGEIIDEGEFICYYCRLQCIYNNLNEFCIKCGMHKDNCRCADKSYHFSGITAPFYNESIAQKIMYDFKFRNRHICANFFAEQMALAVRQSFNDVEFDAVCCVPIGLKTRLKRGYNQSELLAKNVAQKFNIPFLSNVIGSFQKKKPQHKMPLKQRYENVKDVFFLNKTLKNKTVLLVDDIKTSGATLDECAKTLMRGGANKVYCVTGLVTDLKGNKEKNGN